MFNQYSGLNEMLESDQVARDFYDSLPDYVRDQIQTRADSVNSVKSLRDYAENLLRGDD